MVCTGRHHGFESLEDARLLLALHFVTVAEVPMRAFMVERYGDKAGLRAAEVPQPHVGADDVLVRIHAPPTARD